MQEKYNKDKNNMKILWLPIFSMRSYVTSKYAVTKDGNFQLTLARILASNFDEITVALPFEISDFEEFQEQMLDKFIGRNIEFTFLHYGINAVDTRKTFWKANRDFFFDEGILDYDLVITDITGYAGTMSYDIPFINNFNVTKLPELDRPYIDEFFAQDMVSMEKALFTTVINPRQRDYILEIAPHLKDKVFAYTKVAHDNFLPVQSQTKLLTTNQVIFWPFRISDKSYKFLEFIEMFEKSGHTGRYDVVITDPNDTYTLDKNFIIKTKLTKEQYYWTLEKRPFVIMLDDIDTVLHPGTVEFMRYGCRMITFENKLIPHKGMIKSIDEIPQKLTEMGYNGDINSTDFVYSSKEVSKLYSKEHINRCLQNL